MLNFLIIVRPIEDSEKTSAEDQKMFCSEIVMLLNLIQHSRPDVANVT